MSPSTFSLRPFAPADAGWVVTAHRRLYAAEEGYDDSFAELVTTILSEFISSFDEQTEAGWIAEMGHQPVGSVFCKREDAQTARLRMLLVEPEARGTGLGRHLVRTCMEFARSRGYLRMVLWTHESHRAACAVYQSEGWRLVSSTPGTAFGVAVVDQEWAIDLGP